MKKNIAVALFISIVFANVTFVANAQDEWPFKHELTHTKVKLNHAPFWMLDEKDSKKDTIPEKNIYTDEWNFVDDLFWDTIFSEDANNPESTDNSNSNNNIDLEQDNFLNNLFWDGLEWEEQWTNTSTEDWTAWNWGNIESQNNNPAPDNWSEWLEDIDALFWDLFSKTIDQNNNIAIKNNILDIKKRKLQFKIAQKKKRILARKLAWIQAL